MDVSFNFFVSELSLLRHIFYSKIEMHFTYIKPLKKNYDIYLVV